MFYLTLNKQMLFRGLRLLLISLPAARLWLHHRRLVLLHLRCVLLTSPIDSNKPVAAHCERRFERCHSCCMLRERDENGLLLVCEVDSDYFTCTAKQSVDIRSNNGQGWLADNQHTSQRNLQWTINSQFIEQTVHRTQHARASYYRIVRNAIASFFR